ncbi:MAG: DUF3298 and DUF4163 domain-containing protein [Limnochordaceae bacterium]|nr:DUF3298 and DUF4163 domain-containing protein [Limnochordaceae bacterium]
MRQSERSSRNVQRVRGQGWGLALCLVTGLATVSLPAYTAVAATGPATAAAAAATAATASRNAVVAVNPRVVEWKTELITVHLRIPILSGLADQATQEALNQANESRALAFAKSIEKMAQEDWTGEHMAEAKAEGWFHPYEAWVDYEVKNLDDRWISLRMEFYQYTGGAHGGTVVEGTTYDAKTGRQLQLKEFFPAGTDYRAIIAREVARQIQATKDIYFPDASSHAADFAEDAFYVDHGTLVVFFGQYELAPYAAGIREFRIPTSYLSPWPARRRTE